MNPIESDLANMTAFVENILKGHRAGVVEPASAAGALLSTMVAVGAGDLDQARAWFDEGRPNASRGATRRRDSRSEHP